MSRPLKTKLSITADELIPAEVPTPIKLLRSADCYQQLGVKYPHLGTFHSYAELLSFALAEGDPSVSVFVPRPFRLQISGRPYIPDAYIINKGIRHVIEIKPRAEFDPALKQSLCAFFELKDMKFEVVSNESFLEKEILALNWLHVIRILCISSLLTTNNEEEELWGEIAASGAAAVGDLIDSGDRFRSQLREIALFRLLHRGVASANWSEHRLSYDTEISICK